MNIKHENSHFAALDGVRGLAIALVLAFHLFPLVPTGPISSFIANLIRSGWLGVDLFFVLSGFLITRNLLETKSKENFFKNFYARRTLRIFPLYYAYLALFALISLWFLSHGDQTLKEKAQIAFAELPWVLAYLTNFLIVSKGYFITASINHFWSLAIEEQFYLVWPAVIKFTKEINLSLLCLLFALCTLILRVFMSIKYGPSYALYVLPFFRLDQFAIGAFFSLLIRDPKIRTPATLFKVQLTFIISFAALILFFIYAKGSLNNLDVWVQSLGYTVFGIIFGSLIYLAIETKRLSSFFQNTALRFFGKFSYGLYVFHWPIFIGIHLLGNKYNFLSGTDHYTVCLRGVITLILSILISLLSWHGYEKHFLKLKNAFA